MFFFYAVYGSYYTKWKSLIVEDILIRFSLFLTKDPSLKVRKLASTF